MGGSGFWESDIVFFWDKQLMMASTKHKQEREKSLCNYKDLCDRHMKDIESAKTDIQKSGSNRCDIISFIALWVLGSQNIFTWLFGANTIH